MVGPSQRHRLLERQLRKARGPGGGVDVERLLDLVSGAYDEHDRARQLADHANRLMSEELYALNAKVRAEAAATVRAAEERLFALLEGIGDGALVTDGEGVVCALNASAEAMFGLERAAVVGRSLATLGAVCSPADAGFLLRGLGESGAELTGLRAGGEIFTAEVSASRLELDGRRRIVTLWRDVTARKAAEAALRQARDDADDASRAKSEFLAAMSHEIRTPLNGVLGTAGALARTRLDLEQQAMVRVMLESGEVLTAILSDILDLSKIEAGRLDLETAPFNLRETLESVADLFRATARGRGLTLTADIAPELEVTAVGDSARLRQVVQNLLSNAIKFTGEGVVALRARLRSEPGGRQARLVVEVLDTGCGVPEAARPRLFTRFTQADRSTTRKFGGTGLGLALCRELVEAMGGEIGMWPREGGGSCFWFEAPLRVENAQVEADTVCGPEGPALAGLRVLGVDDNATNRFVLRTILETVGCEVALAEDGAQALAAAEAQLFDVILMDVHMPVMDGLQAARAIRALPGAKGEVPIIAVTAEALADHVARAKAAGMDAHVAKPIRPDRLFQVLVETLAAAGPARLRAAG